MSSEILYRQYASEADLPHIISLVQSELSEPYVIYTYRYFLQQWAHLAFIAYPADSPETPVGVIISKQEMHQSGGGNGRGEMNRGYIAMLSVGRAWRKRGIASKLVQLTVDSMIANGADEITLETEYDNRAALGLYASLGFIRAKRLYHFYMTGKDAFRLVLALRPNSTLSPPGTPPPPPNAI